MRPLKEINAERDALAKAVFVREQIKAWQEKARADAEADSYNPPPFIGELGTHVYTMAWSSRRNKIGRAERDADDAKARSTV